MAPNFSPFPFAALRRVSRADAAIESLLARWICARTTAWPKLAALVGGPVGVRILGVRAPAIDPYAAVAEIRVGGAAIVIASSSAPVRAITQRLLGGPAELAAPRPLTSVEQAIWALVVGAALEDAGIAGEVWPRTELPAAVIANVVDSTIAARPSSVRRGDPPEAAPGDRGQAPAGAGTVVGVARGAAGSGPRDRAPAALGPGTVVGVARGAGASRSGDRAAAPAGAVGLGGPLAFELVADLAGATSTVTVLLPPELAVRVPPPRPWPTWAFAVPVVLGRCAIHRGDVARLAVRDVITLDRCLELSLGPGAIALSAAPGAIEAAVATGYVPRDMALPDDAHLELTVQLGTTQLTLRQLADLVPGAIVPLGRPLAGPYEVHAGGRLVGRGELVDVDGELGVRIVSLQEQ